MSRVDQLKDGSGYVPVLLCVFTFQDSASTTFLCSTHPFDTVSGPAFPGIGVLPAGDYVARIKQQDISSFQQRSQLGIDRISQVAIHLIDADSYIYNYYVSPTGLGFRGATVQMALVMWLPGTGTFSSDAPVMFVGTCDMEVSQHGCTEYVVTANNSHNTATISQPAFPIQNRCPKIFPPDGPSRALAVNPYDPTYGPCGYSADQPGGYGNIATTGGPANDGKNVVDAYGNQVTDSNGIYIVCDFLRSNKSGTDSNVGCMARLGNYANHSVAPDGDLAHDRGNSPYTSPPNTVHHTGAFAGVEWSPGTYYAINLNYVTQSQVATYSYLNPAVLGQYQNLLYGTQFVTAKLANIVEDGNATKMEAMICTGDIQSNGISSNDNGYLVIVNGVQITKTTVDSNGFLDQQLTWRWVNTGSRNGQMNTDSGYSTSIYSALGDPYGSIACIEAVVYSNIFTGFGTPTVQILTTGPIINAYAAIVSASGSGSYITLSFATTTSNYGINYAIGSGSKIYIYGCSWNVVNGLQAVHSASAYSIILETTGSGSGAGGFIQYQGTPYPLPWTDQSSIPSDSAAVTINPNCNPAWVVVDFLQRCNWDLSEIDIPSFCVLADISFQQIKYLNQSAALATHARYKLQLCLEQRQKASIVIAGMLRAFNGYTAWSQQGLLQGFINQTLADSQPSPITGSNYNTAVNSTTAQFQGAYASTNTYSYGDVVTYSGSYYRSILLNNYDGQPLNTGNVPSGSPTQWALYGGTGSQPVGYVAYSFDETNIIQLGSTGDFYMDVEQDQNPTANTPNQIYINFQDEDNSFVQDSLSEINADAASRSAGALQPGGALIPETISAIGISNFDQGIRVSNVYMAERQYGNVRGDAGGTTIFTIGTTVRCEHLRVGHLVFLSLVKYGMVKQLFRVIDKQASTDFVTAKIKLQWHDDEWYEDIYGQAPQAFQSQPSTNGPGRAPLPWQPSQISPISKIWSSTEWNFAIFENSIQSSNGSIDIILEAKGYLPINNIGGSVQPPRVPVNGNVSTTGGSIAGNQTVLIQIVAWNGTDPGNYRSAPSQTIVASVPSGTNTNTITINNINWYPGSTNYTLYAGISHFSITSQSGGAISGNTIILTSLPNALQLAPPDLGAGTVQVKAKNVYHAGIVGSSVIATTSSTVTIGGPGYGTFTADLTTNPHYLMLLGRPSVQGGWDSSVSDLPIVDFLITGYTVSGGALVLSVTGGGTPSALFAINDAVVITAGNSTADASKIGDASASYAAGNTYYPTGTGAFSGEKSGNIVRIIGGTGRFQTRPIKEVSSDGSTLTTTTPWQTTPDATSVFIVEDSSWILSSINTSPFTVQNYSQALQSLNCNVGNVPGQTVLFQALIGDPSGTKFSSENRSPFRIYYIFGDNGYWEIVPSGGVALLDPANGVTQIVTLPNDGSLLTITIAGTPPVAGFGLTLYVRTPATGNWQTPAFTGGVDGFAADVAAGTRYSVSPTASTQDELPFSWHGAGSTVTLGNPVIGGSIP